MKKQAPERFNGLVTNLGHSLRTFVEACSRLPRDMPHYSSTDGVTRELEKANASRASIWAEFLLKHAPALRRKRGKQMPIADKDLLRTLDRDLKAILKLRHKLWLRAEDGVLFKNPAITEELRELLQNQAFLTWSGKLSCAVSMRCVLSVMDAQDAGLYEGYRRAQMLSPLPAGHPYRTEWDEMQRIYADARKRMVDASA